MSVTKKKSEPTPKERADAVLACALENCQNASWVTLWYLSQGDQLSPEQVQQIFDGDFESVDDHIQEWFREYDQDMVNDYVKDFVPDEDDRDLLEEHDLLSELETAIRDKDDSDPVGELMRVTRDVWLRWPLDVEVLGWMSAAELDYAIDDLCSALGISRAENEKALCELIQTCEAQGDAYILWHSTIKKACETFLWQDWSSTEDPKVRWTDPILYVAGFTAHLKGYVSVHATGQQLHAMPELETDFHSPEMEVTCSAPTIVGAFDEYREGLLQFFEYRSKILEGTHA